MEDDDGVNARTPHTDAEGEGEGVQMAATNDSLWPAGMQLLDHAPIIIDARRSC